MFSVPTIYSEVNAADPAHKSIFIFFNVHLVFVILFKLIVFRFQICFDVWFFFCYCIQTLKVLSLLILLFLQIKRDIDDLLS